MSRIAYVNGRYVPHGDAAVHVEDRGYQFADGVYEACESLVDIEDTLAVSRAHGRVFGEIKPANTLIKAGGLVGDFLVEIEAEAIVR